MDLLLPALVALVVSAVLSTAGISGAFLLLPFQVSVLGLSTPGVSATNHLFNVLATPAGVLRYWRDGRIPWPLAAVIGLATLPGALAGALLRLRWLADPGAFRALLGAVLLLLAGRLVWSLWRGPAADPHPAPSACVTGARLGLDRLEYRFDGAAYQAATVPLAALGLAIGVVGGALGVGGGSLLAPLLVGLWGLPPHTTAGATLLGNLVTSGAALGVFLAVGGTSGAPDLGLGLAMGAGGLAGSFAGASLQRYVPPRAVRAVLALATGALALLYLVRNGT